MTPLATNVSTTSFTDTGLTNGTAYFYTVRAVERAPAPRPRPTRRPRRRGRRATAPLNLTASAGNASAQLAWSVPASNGGSTITGYNVYRGTSAGGEATTPVATNMASTTFVDSGLTNGTRYFYTVAAVNAAGVSPPSNEASATPQAATGAGFVHRVGSLTASATRTSSTLSVGTGGAGAGHALVLSLLLSSTTSVTGTVGASDTVGNTYAVARDINDGGAGDRTVTLVALNARALAAGATITLTYPSSAETHLSVDEYAGVTGVDISAGSSSSGSAFTSGSTAPTSQANEILVGDVGAESATTPGWASGWTGLPTLAVSTDYLGTAYRLVTATGSYAATGTVGGQWMAGIVALRTG